MRATELSRGFILPYVMLVCVAMLALVALLLTSAADLSHGTSSIQGKNATLDAAEAGLNDALDALNISLSRSGATTGSIANGYAYTYTIYPNFAAALNIAISDPVRRGGTVNVPGGSAVIISVGTNPNGGRSSTVEAVVMAHSAKVNFHKYAVIAGRNIQGSYQNGITDLGHGNNALVHANGSINASVSGTIQGSVTASGDTNTLFSGKTGTPSLALPTVGQFDTLVSNYEDATKLYPGPTDLYLSAGSMLSSAYDCPTPAPADGCLLFYDGPLNLTSQPISFNGQWTLVVNGDLTQGSTASIVFAGHPGLVVANGNASIEGVGLTNAYVEVKGSTQFGGTGPFSGAILTLGNFTFDSNNSTGPFQFDALVVPPSKTITGRVKVVTYTEY